MNSVIIVLQIFPPALKAQSTGDWSFPGDRIEESEGRGLLIRSNPLGSKVYIDGIGRGSTPLRLENLRAGSYFMRVEKEGYVERRFRVSVRPGSLMIISVELKMAVGRVLLKPAPESPRPFVPRISVDGRALDFPGKSTYSSEALEIPVGFRNILVRAFGWEDISSILYYRRRFFQGT